MQDDDDDRADLLAGQGMPTKAGMWTGQFVHCETFGRADYVAVEHTEFHTGLSVYDAGSIHAAYDAA